MVLFFRIFVCMCYFRRVYMFVDWSINVIIYKEYFWVGVLCS